ncbi:hypothetical protein Tco_1194276 [Tanacetum coccineum]
MSSSKGEAEARTTISKSTSKGNKSLQTESMSSSKEKYFEAFTRKGWMETPAAPIKSTNVLDLSITHMLQLETPTGDSIGSSSVHTSGSEKKRQRTVERGIVVIDLLDSE